MRSVKQSTLLLKLYWKPRVIEKRPFDIYAHVMSAAGTILPGRKHPTGILQSAKVIVEMELVRIGFTRREIKDYCESQNIPPPGLIEDKVRNFQTTGSVLGEDDNPWGSLPIHAYYECFTFLGEFYVIREAAVENDLRGRELYPHQWISMGLMLGWQLSSIGVHTIAEISESVRAENRAERRRGKNYSAARIGLRMLIDKGFGTGKKVTEFLESNDYIDGTAIRVSKEQDRWGKTTAYVFFDESSARTDKLECKSVGPTVSNLKKLIQSQQTN